MKHMVIYKEKEHYCCFPHIARISDGSLAIVFRRAGKFSAEAALRGQTTHHDMDSSIEAIFSFDEAETWPRESRKTIYKSSYGVNDPSLTCLSDGSMLVRFVALEVVPSLRWGGRLDKIFAHRVDHGLVTMIVGNVLMLSTDCGKTWKTLGMLKAGELTRSVSRDPLIEMPDGSLLASVYEGAPQRCDRSWLLRSFDKGKTWHEPVILMADERWSGSQLQGVNFNETSLVHLGNGEVFAMVRGDTSFHIENEFVPVGGVGELYSARSYDAGLSWTLPQKTGIWGQPGSVLLLSNGDLLCTYGYRRKPYGVRCVVSKDKGRTWDLSREYVIRDDGTTWDLGYPFSIELKNGNIFSTYYFVDEVGTRYIAGTTWS